MTLPTTGPISIAMVAAELGISSAGLSLGDARVRALAGKPTGPISLGDLRGKSADGGGGGGGATFSLTAERGIAGGAIGYEKDVYGSITSEPLGANVMQEITAAYVEGPDVTTVRMVFQGDARPQLTGKSLRKTSPASVISAITAGDLVYASGVTTFEKITPGDTAPFDEGQTYALEIS